MRAKLGLSISTPCIIPGLLAAPLLNGPPRANAWRPPSRRPYHPANGTRLTEPLSSVRHRSSRFSRRAATMTQVPGLLGTACCLREPGGDGRHTMLPRMQASCSAAAAAAVRLPAAAPAVFTPQLHAPPCAAPLQEAPAKKQKTEAASNGIFQRHEHVMCVVGLCTLLPWHRPRAANRQPWLHTSPPCLH